MFLVKKSKKNGFKKVSIKDRKHRQYGIEKLENFKKNLLVCFTNYCL